MERGGRTRSLRGRASQASTASPAIRCFVALQPDEAALERLDRLAHEQCLRFPSARRMRRENLHLTLAFIGALGVDTAREVAARLAAEPAAPFEWSLDAIGAFAGARVLWVGGTDPRLDAMATRSRELLDELGVPFDRKPFVAHVTLLRNVPREAAREIAGAIEPPVHWHAGMPVLLESKAGDQGVRYTPVAAHAGNG